ncbi:MAG: hypothetical protein V7K48_29950 [Nostoc sp.]
MSTNGCQILLMLTPIAMPAAGYTYANYPPEVLILKAAGIALVS